LTECQLLHISLKVPDVRFLQNLFAERKVLGLDRLYLDARRHYDVRSDRNGVLKPHILRLFQSRVLGRIFGSKDRNGKKRLKKPHN
jgi:hypothetical protein